MLKRLPAFKKITNKLIEASHSKYGHGVLYTVSFLGSSIFPTPPDFLMFPMVVAKPDSWKKLALWVTVASVAGTFLGYAIGGLLFDTIGQAIVEAYQLENEMAQVGRMYNNNVFWSLFLAAFTPIPFKVFTIAGGVFGVDLLPFFLASVLGRGMRYGILGYVAHLGGKKTLWSKVGKILGFPSRNTPKKKHA